MTRENETMEQAISILVVEDNDTDFLLLQRQLLKLLPSSTCKRAINRSELIELLQHPYDLIVSDYHLPDIEGENLLLLIAQSHFNTPCLLLSGSIESVTSLDTPAHVQARLQKGDTAALRAAVVAIVQQR
jgi:CheY-like chemotaxis protein